MKFVYKINSGYDGFTPTKLPDRLEPPNLISLGWKTYLDDVEPGMEVWVYFLGPQRFQPGVYLRGSVWDVNYADERVTLRVSEYSPKEPLTSDETSKLVGDLVNVRYRQVFVLPEEMEPLVAATQIDVPGRVRPVECTVATTASSCADRVCTGCSTWSTLPLIKSDDVWWPPSLTERFIDFVPAYWVIPRRCYWGRSVLAAGVRRTSEVFYSFKVGDRNLAFPLALGMEQALRARDLIDFDCLVPIPLSPDKAERGELHRTRELARELGTLLDLPVVEALTLTEAVSKRRLLASGWGASYFASKYMQALDVPRRVSRYRRILVVDDVCTRGTTLSVALRRLMMEDEDLEIAAATAGQMVLKPVVRNEEAVLAS